MRDVIKTPIRVYGDFYFENEASAVSFIMIPIVVFSMISSLIFGKLSDLLGAKAIFITMNTIFYISFPICLIFSKNYLLSFLFSILFGIGQGIPIKLTKGVI
jgi:MFS family permease